MGPELGHNSTVYVARTMFGIYVSLEYLIIPHGGRRRRRLQLQSTAARQDRTIIYCFWFWFWLHMLKWAFSLGEGVGSHKDRLGLLTIWRQAQGVYLPSQWSWLIYQLPMGLSWTLEMGPIPQVGWHCYESPETTMPIGFFFCFFNFKILKLNFILEFKKIISSYVP